MFEKIIAPIAAWIIAVISSLGYAGIALLMAIESACIPLPSEIIMPFSGYLVSTGRFDLVLVATAGAIGCNIGSTVAYAIGFYGGRPLVERWGYWALIGRRELALLMVDRGRRRNPIDEIEIIEYRLQANGRAHSSVCAHGIGCRAEDDQIWARLRIA